MLLLTLLTMTSWAEETKMEEDKKASEVHHKDDTKDHKKKESTSHIDENKKEDVKEHKKSKHRHHGKTKTTRSDHDIDGKHLTKYSVNGLKALHKLLKSAVERNEVRDSEDLERRLDYQKKRGGKTPCGASYAGLSMTHFLNVIEDETREMEADMKDIEKELEKRGHKCGCPSR